MKAQRVTPKESKASPRAASAAREAKASRQADAPRQANASRQPEAPSKANTPRKADAPRNAIASRKAIAPRKAKVPRETDASRRTEVSRRANEARGAPTDSPLRAIVAGLRTMQAPAGKPPGADVWEHLLRENIAYLVDDARREATFRALKDHVGTSPEAILAVDLSVLARVIEHGGMQPEHRARKLVRCAELAQQIGLQRLRDTVAAAGPDARATAEARKLLKRFPGIGDPGADKLLMLARRAVTLAPDSNALRVLVRAGFTPEQDSYAAMYKSAAAAVSPQLPFDPEWLIEAHQLLRHHGQDVCRRSEPQCPRCAVRPLCATGRATA